MNDFRFNHLIHIFKNDKFAFDEIYAYYFPRIRVFIGRKYNDYHLGEDIAQEFFMKLFRITIPERINYPTVWVFNACDNLAKTHLSAHMVNEVLPLHEESLAAADAVNDSANLKNGGISEENIEALKKLDATTIEIFVMYFWEGYNYKEIAEILGMSHDQVRQKASRGIRKLKKYFINCHSLILLLSLLR